MLTEWQLLSLVLFIGLIMMSVALVMCYKLVELMSGKIARLRRILQGNLMSQTDIDALRMATSDPSLDSKQVVAAMVVARAKLNQQPAIKESEGA